ncbi:hypothetical protein ACHQM5_015447 [Ranunculus cassubicifolius]
MATLDPKAVSWSSLVSKNSNGKGLSTLPRVVPELKDGFFEVPASVYEKGVQKWRDHIVGFFVDKRVSFLRVQEQLEDKWKLKGKFEMASDIQLFYFKFHNPEDKKSVLELGPIFINRKLFVVLPWSEEVETKRQQINVLPIWVKVYQVPKQMWTDEGLAFIAGLIGTPLYTDELTKGAERLEFANLCVEISAATKLEK